MKLNLLLLFLVSLTSVTFASNDGNVYSAPIVKRLGIHEPPPMTLDRVSGQHHERDIANFLLEQYGRHRHMTESLASFYLSHPKTSLAYASMCVSNLNALVESKAWVKLSKSNRAILNASDRKLFKDRLIRDFDLCSSLIARFLGNRASSSYVEPITLPVATASSSSSAIRPKKKWNVSKEDWLILQEAKRNFPHDREEYRRQHPYDPRLDNYEPPRISFGEDGHLRYDSNYQ